MLNRVVLIGRLTRDPELRYTQSGIAVGRFTLAVDRRFANQQGERGTDFINIVVWRGIAENCANYLRKGSLVGLEGRLQTGKYENQEGRTVYTTEVVADDVRFLEPKGRAEQRVGAASEASQAATMDPSQDPFAADAQKIDVSEDDLPF